MMDERASARWGWAGALQVLAFAVALFGLKLWLIRSYANGTPYWDQWDAEAELFKRLLSGDWAWDRWLAPHNEHRIFTTRLLAVALLWLNQLWSPMLEMVANAILHIAALVCLMWLFARAIGRFAMPVLLMFALVVFAVPFAWENTITGFQGQFYFLLLFSSLSIWLLITAPVLQGRWWLGVALAIAAFFSFASGAFAVYAAFAAQAIRLLLLRRTRRDWGALLVLAVLAAAVTAGIPMVAQHTDLKAKSFAQFFHALLSGLAWPTLTRHPAFAALMRNLPWLIFVAGMMRRPPAAEDRRWFVVAIGIWVAGQTVAVAYGRADDVLVSRYLDLHSIGLLVNMAALLALTRGLVGRARMGALILSACWMFFFVNALVAQLDSFLAQAAGKHESSLKQESNVRSYLLTHDLAAARALPFFALPYPDADRLTGLLGSPAIAPILPENLQFSFAPAAIEARGNPVFVPDGVYKSTPPCKGCGAMGSYGEAGDAATGEVLLHYDPPPPIGGGSTLRMPVAGYPSRSGRIELIQNGIAKELKLRSDPGEQWAKLHFQVEPGPFDIRVVDDSPTGWIAVGQPARGGRLDPLVDWLLARAERFVALGAVLASLAILATLHATDRASRQPGP
jgi:hypothetical protein